MYKSCIKYNCDLLSVLEYGKTIDIYASDVLSSQTSMVENLMNCGVGALSIFTHWPKWPECWF